MTKLLQNKEWLSFDEALRYACAVTGETIKNEDFLPILLEKKVPIIIYPKDFGYSVDESDSFRRYSYLLRLLPSSKLHFYCEVSINRIGQDSNSLGIETEYGLLTPIHYLGVAVNPDISFLMPRLPDYSQSDTYYEYMPLLVDEIKDGKKINSHASAVYYHMWNTDNKEHDMNKTRIDCITWQDLLSPVIGKNGIGIDGSFIKPLFKRDAIDSLLNFDTTQVGSNGLENEALKIKIAELERKLNNRIDIREVRTYQNFIVALLDYIKGSPLGIDKHPHFLTESKLIDFIDEKFDGYQGLSKSNLSHKLPKIKEAFNKQ
ncbi:MAG: hypothetical protein Q7S87_07060 [Agitococcus sp.]|nr:hypothetical protein [Agitococcus sp.]